MGGLIGFWFFIIFVFILFILFLFRGFEGNLGIGFDGFYWMVGGIKWREWVLDGVLLLLGVWLGLDFGWGWYLYLAFDSNLMRNTVISLWWFSFPL
jgi:hypothetical protein